MPSDEASSELEARGVELAKQGQYAEARRILGEVLSTKTVPLHRGQVLRNIALAYEREGNKEEAIRAYQRILDAPGLCETNDGVYLHGQITGHVRRMQGGSVWGATSVYALFASYCIGAAIGAALGSKAPGAGHTIFGRAVDQDLRYGGACLGALLGVFLFSRTAAAAGPALSWIGGIACAGLTTYILLEENVKLGLIILANLVFLPLFIGYVLAARYRNT
jgi:tetratricopeptide (TPR) repeat protein